MHPGAERIWDISYWRKQLMQHMMLIGQYLSKQFVILFLANMNERNLFRQKAKTFEFVHNRLNAGLWHFTVAVVLLSFIRHCYHCLPCIITCYLIKPRDSVCYETRLSL